MEQLLNLVEEFEKKVLEYEKYSSSANREALYQSYLVVKKHIDGTNDDVKIKLIDTWSVVDANIQSFRVLSNGWMSFSSFGATDKGSKANITVIKPQLLRIKKILNEIIYGVTEEVSELDEQTKVKLNYFKTLLNEFREKVENYSKANSSANREAVYQTYLKTKKQYDILPEDIRLDLNENWFVIDAQMPSFRQLSNGWVKFSTFGTSNIGSNTLVNNFLSSCLKLINRIEQLLK